MNTADLMNPDALVKRVKRSPERAELGAFYVVDARGIVTDRNVDRCALLLKLPVSATDQCRRPRLLVDGECVRDRSVGV